MKTPEELNVLKNEVEALNKKLSELSEDELQQVTGGAGPRGPVVHTDPFVANVAREADGTQNLFD